MPVRTRIDRSGTRVRGERGVVDAEFDAIDEVVDRVGDPSTESARWAAGGAVAAGGGLVRAGSATGERRRTGRTVLAGTIRPHGAADVADAEPRLGTTREAFTDAVAVALAPTTAASLAPELERAGLAEAGSRRSEAAASRGRSVARRRTSTVQPGRSTTSSRGSSTRTGRRRPVLGVDEPSRGAARGVPSGGTHGEAAPSRIAWRRSGRARRGRGRGGVGRATGRRPRAASRTPAGRRTTVDRFVEPGPS